MNNRFYDLLPNEIINKIYTFDNTYKKVYDKVVETIGRFPEFHSNEKDYFVFLKVYRFPSFEMQDFSRVSNKKYSFKKAIFIIIEALSTSNTIKR